MKYSTTEDIVVTGKTRQSNQKIHPTGFLDLKNLFDKIYQ